MKPNNTQNQQNQGHIIPNKIHFIWYGNDNITRENRDANIKAWRQAQPEHEINVWIDRRFITQKEYENLLAWAETLQVKLRDRNDPQDGLDLTKNKKQHEIQQYSLCGPFPNYGAATDVDRLLILEKEGGIYMDATDVAPVKGKPFPKDMRAEQGVLFNGSSQTSVRAKKDQYRGLIKDECLDEINFELGTNLGNDAFAAEPNNETITQIIAEIPSALLKAIHWYTNDFKTYTQEAIGWTCITTGPDFLAKTLHELGIKKTPYTRTEDPDDLPSQYAIQGNISPTSSKKNANNDITWLQSNERDDLTWLQNNERRDGIGGHWGKLPKKTAANNKVYFEQIAFKLVYDFGLIDIQRQGYLYAKGNKDAAKNSFTKNWYSYLLGYLQHAPEPITTETFNALRENVLKAVPVPQKEEINALFEKVKTETTVNFSYSSKSDKSEVEENFSPPPAVKTSTPISEMPIKQVTAPILSKEKQKFISDIDTEINRINCTKYDKNNLGVYKVIVLTFYKHAVQKADSQIPLYVIIEKIKKLTVKGILESGILDNEELNKVECLKNLLTSLMKIEKLDEFKTVQDKLIHNLESKQLNGSSYSLLSEHRDDNRFFKYFKPKSQQLIDEYARPAKYKADKLEEAFLEAMAKKVAQKNSLEASSSNNSSPTLK